MMLLHLIGIKDDPPAARMIRFSPSRN